MMIYRALGALLQYPGPGLLEAAPEIGAVLHADDRLSGKTLDAVGRLLSRLGKSELLAAQEIYVGQFDRSRSLSLHLFEHIHGESRDRGQAMVNLAAHYETAGYRIDANELPDYLPLFLEFLSLRPAEEARGLLGNVVHILSAIRIRLERRGSDYAAVFAALEDVADRKAPRAAVEDLLEHDRTPEAEAAALDSDWEEVPAFAGDGSCPAARETLNRMAELSLPTDDARDGA